MELFNSRRCAENLSGGTPEPCRPRRPRQPRCPHLEKLTVISVSDGLCSSVAAALQLPNQSWWHRVKMHTPLSHCLFFRSVWNTLTKNSLGRRCFTDLHLQAAPSRVPAVLWLWILLCGTPSRPAFKSTSLEFLSQFPSILDYNLNCNLTQIIPPELIQNLLCKERQNRWKVFFMSLTDWEE